LNKILIYTVIAIMLGTVTMVVPLALLGHSDYNPMTEGSPLNQPEATETPSPEPTEPPEGTEKLENHDRSYTDAEDLLSGDSLALVPAAPAEPEPTPEPEQPEPSEQTPEPLEPELVEPSLMGAESSLDLSPVGLMTIPSFMIALGVFVYFKKRMF
jgi:hypothetical protein